MERVRAAPRHGDQHGAQHPATSPRVGSVGRPGPHRRRDLVDQLHQFLVREPEAHGAVPGAVPLEVDVAGADVPIDIGQHPRKERHERAAVIVRGHPAQFVRGELGVGDRQRVGPFHGAAHPPLVHHCEDTRLG